MSKEIKMWWHDNEGVSNFGDILSPYLVEKITKKKPIFCAASRFPWPKTHMVIGSILAASSNNCIIWGAGVISKNTKVHGGKFIAVRGPITREVLINQGFKVPKIYGDPAILLPQYFNPSVNKEYEIGIIPHIVDYQHVKEKIKDEQIFVIDLRDNVEEVVRNILKCKFTFSSSLHGIIVSHTYGIPSLWMKVSDKLFGDDVKFEDYFSSVNIIGYVALLPEFNFEKLNNLKQSTPIESLPKVDLNEMRSLLMSVCPFK